MQRSKTTIQILTNNNISATNIMQLSGHKNIQSTTSCSAVSGQQQLQISRTLRGLPTGSEEKRNASQEDAKNHFPPLCYEDALKKPGLILLQQRREDVYITFLKRSYSSCHLLRNLVPLVTYTKLYALGTGEIFLTACLFKN